MPKRILKILGATIAAVVVLAVGAIGLFVATFDPNDYRERIEDSLSSTLGRQVRLAGDIELVPSMIPTVAVNEVAIANPPWASRPIMASAGRLEARVALRPLLDRRIEIAHVLLERVDVLLERGDDGRGNWEFALGGEAGNADAAGTADTTGPGFEASVDRIELHDITAQYVAPDGTEVAGHVEALTLAHSSTGEISILATGRLQTLPVVAEWQAGPLDEAAEAGGLRWPVTARFSLGESTATLTGRLAAPLAFLQSDFEFGVTGRNASQLLELAGFAPILNLAYELQGRARIDPERLELADLQGSFSIEDTGLEAGIDSGSLRLARDQRVEVSLAGTASGMPFSVSAQLGRLRDMLAASEPWPLDVEAAVGEASASGTGTVSIGGGDPLVELDLRARGLQTRGPLTFGARFVAEPNRLAFSDLSLAIAAGTIEGDIVLTDLATTPVVSGSLAAASLDIGAPAQDNAPAVDAAPARNDAPAAQTAVADRDLPLHWLEAVSGSLALTVGELHGLPLPLSDAALRVELANGELAITDASARLAGLELRGHGSLTQARDEAAVAFEIFAETAESASLLPALGIEAPAGLAWTAGPAALRVDAHGGSVRGLVETSRFDLTVGESALDYAIDDRHAEVDLSELRLAAAPEGPTELFASGMLAADVRGEAIETPFELALSTGSLQELLREPARLPPIELRVNGANHRDEPLQLQALVGDPSALLNQTASAVLLNLAWGPLAGRIDAQLVPSATLTGTTGELSLTTDDLGAAADLLGYQNLPAGQASLSGRFGLDQGAIELSELAASLPGVEAAGQISLNRNDPPTTNADIHFALLDLTAYVAPREAAVTSDALPAAQSSVLAPHELLSDVPIGLPRLRETGVGAELRASIDEFRFGTFISRDNAARLTLVRGDVQLEMSFDAGALTASAEIDAREEDVVLRLELAGDAVPLTVDRTVAPAPNTAVMAVNAALTGRGRTTRAIAESLQGEIEIYLTGGRIQASGLRFLFGSVIYQILDVINPFTQRQNFIEIDCAGAYFDVTAGAITTRNGIIMQTKDLQVVGIGGLHVTDSTLEMEFQTKRRTGIAPSIGGIVNEFVELSGTLGRPRVQVSTRRAARSGLIAIATGGLSLIATDLFGRLTSGNVCEDLATRVSAVDE